MQIESDQISQAPVIELPSASLPSSPSNPLKPNRGDAKPALRRSNSGFGSSFLEAQVMVKTQQLFPCKIFNISSACF
jgi:hypothetical protein